VEKALSQPGNAVKSGKWGNEGKRGRGWEKGEMVGGGKVPAVFI